MIVSVSLAADRELTEGTRYYAARAGSEVGFAFVLEYERAIALLSKHPELGTVWRNQRRRFPMRRFPYSIIYYQVGDKLRVIALAHHRRKPGFREVRR